MLSINHIKALKTQLPFYSKLTLQEQHLISDNAVIRHYTKGSELLNGVSECSGLILVISGRLRAYYAVEDGKQITLYRLLEGDVCIMSASCVLRNLTFDLSLEFESDSEILIVPTSIWSRLSNNSLIAKDFAMELMASRFSEVMWVMEQLIFKGFAQRLAACLIDEAALGQSNKISVTHEYLAKNLSTAREVVSRALKHFESDGIIKLSRGSIDIINLQRLHSLT